MRDAATIEPPADGLARTELLWLQPPDELVLRPTEVHVFALHLDDSPDVDRWRCLLSRDEKMRASRFHFEVHRNRFIVGRAWLRTVLGKYLGVKPVKIAFAYGPSGKPDLAGPLETSGLKFNLAHSDDLVLLALTADAQVGVDVERIKPISEAAELVQRFFSPREAGLFDELPAELRSRAFLNLWTRKEALLKATGEGIAHSLKQVEVSFLPHEPARLLSLPIGILPLSRWTLRELHPADGFAAALVVASFPIQLRCFSWPNELKL